jgi:hypothetical protein
VIGAVVVALALGGQPPSDKDLVSRFAGMATLEAGGCMVTAAVMVEDLPTAGYENRFRFVLTLGMQAAREATRCLGRAPAGALPVAVAAVADGSMVASVAGWWRLRVTPGFPEVEAAIKRAAPGAEERMQFVTVTSCGQRITVLIEEPVR